MNLMITGKNMDVTVPIKGYVEDKFGRITKYFEQILNAHVYLSVIKNPSVERNQKVEITVDANGAIIRAEETSDNIYSAIDLASDKIEKRLKKYKNRMIDLSRKAKEVPEETSGTEEVGIVRTKAFTMKPMTPEEAIQEMDLLGHQFFMFLNANTGAINVVYHRKDGQYGIIEPR